MIDCVSAGSRYVLEECTYMRWIGTDRILRCLDGYRKVLREQAVGEP